MGSLISAVLAGYLLIWGSAVHFNLALWLLMAVVLFFSGLTLILQGIAWSALQRAELKATPRIIELLSHRSGLWVVYVVLFGVIATVVLDERWLLPLWVLLSGIVVDVLHHTIKRTGMLLSPREVLALYSVEMKRAIRDDKPKELCQWIEASASAALQAADHKRLSFCLELLDEWYLILKRFLEASKSISHHHSEPGAKGRESDAYVFLFLLQRVEVLNERSIELHLEPVSSGIVTTLAKMIVDAARYDISLAAYPLHYLGKIVRSSSTHGMESVTSKGSCAIVEVSREITEEIDLTYLEISDFFSAAVALLEEEARLIMGGAKRIDMKLIQQPFLQMRGFFQTDKLLSHPDAPVVVRVIDDALVRFQAIEDIMGGNMTSGIGPTAFPAAPPPLDDEGLGAKIVDELEGRLGKTP